MLFSLAPLIGYAQIQHVVNGGLDQLIQLTYVDELDQLIEKKYEPTSVDGIGNFGTEFLIDSTGYICSSFPACAALLPFELCASLFIYHSLTFDIKPSLIMGKEYTIRVKIKNHYINKKLLPYHPNFGLFISEKKDLSVNDMLNITHEFNFPMEMIVDTIWNSFEYHFVATGNERKVLIGINPQFVPFYNNRKIDITDQFKLIKMASIYLNSTSKNKSKKSIDRLRIHYPFWKNLSDSTLAELQCDLGKFFDSKNPVTNPWYLIDDLSITETR
jgi:hypothetical protein